MGNSRKYPYPTTDGFHVLTPPCLRKFQNALPPHALTPIRTNEHEFMPPQGCDLPAPGDKLYSSVTRKTYASCQAVQTPF